MGRDLDLKTYTAPRDEKATMIRAKFTIGQ